MTNLRVAAVQMEHRDADLSYNLSVVESFTNRASKDSVNIISFPECCLTGYMFLGNVTANEIINVAQPVDSEPIDEMKRLAKSDNIIISVGFLERDIEDNVYNSYVSIGPQGIINLYRKLHPFVNPAIKAGTGYSVYDTDGWKASTLICYDNQLIENCRCVALMGTEILFAPHQTGGFDFPEAGMGLIPRELWLNRDADPEPLRREFLGPKGREWIMKWLPSRAYDNVYYVVFANGVGPDGPTEVRTGNARIIDPNGIVVAESNALGDDLIIADCHKEEIEKALGHFHIRSRRPSLYEMITRGPDTSTEPVWERRRKLLEKKGPRPGNCR